MFSTLIVSNRIQIMISYYEHRTKSWETWTRTTCLLWDTGQIFQLSWALASLFVKEYNIYLLEWLWGLSYRKVSGCHRVDSGTVSVNVCSYLLLCKDRYFPFTCRRPELNSNISENHRIGTQWKAGHKVVFRGSLRSTLKVVNTLPIVQMGPAPLPQITPYPHKRFLVQKVTISKSSPVPLWLALPQGKHYLPRGRETHLTTFAEAQKLRSRGRLRAYAIFFFFFFCQNLFSLLLS